MTNEISMTLYDEYNKENNQKSMKYKNELNINILTDYIKNIENEVPEYKVREMLYIKSKLNEIKEITMKIELKDKAKETRIVKAYNDLLYYTIIHNEDEYKETYIKIKRLIE